MRIASATGAPAVSIASTELPSRVIGDWVAANRPPPGPGRIHTTPRAWTSRTASLNVPTETPHCARSSSLEPSRVPARRLRDLRQALRRAARLGLVQPLRRLVSQSERRSDGGSPNRGPWASHKR